MKKFLKTIKDFFFNPTFLARSLDFRWYVCLVIFSIVVSIFIFPIGPIMRSDVNRYGKESKYISVFYSFKDETIYETLKEESIKLEKNKLTTNTDTIHKFKDGNLILVVDSFDTVSNEITDMANSLAEKYDIGKTKAEHIALLGYIDSISQSKDYSDTVEVYVNKSEDYLSNLINQKNYLDIYGITYQKEDKINLMILGHKKMYIQIPNKDEFDALAIEYTHSFDIKNIDNIDSLMCKINESLANSLIDGEINNFTLFTVGYMFLSPLLVGYVLLVIGKKRDTVKYGTNVKLAYALSILPAIICGILAIFVKTYGFVIFMPMYLLYATIYGAIVKKRI